MGQAGQAGEGVSSAAAPMWTDMLRALADGDPRLHHEASPPEERRWTHLLLLLNKRSFVGMVGSRLAQEVRLHGYAPDHATATRPAIPDG